MLTPEGFIIENLFKVPNKEGQDVDFVLNPEQRWLDSNLTGRDIIPKARQMGVSYYFLARMLAKCLAQRNRRCVVISHETDATQRLLQRVHYMLKHLKGPPAQLKFANKNEIQFEATDSSIYIGTAGAKNFGHGDTITDLHCSEVARWENPGPLLRGLFQAVPPTGHVAIESTGNGVGNWYHRACVRANDGIGYKLHFLSWINRPEYRAELQPGEAEEIMADLQEDLEEPEYIKNFELDAAQIKWRRMKIAELDYDLSAFKEQYPCSLEECFQASGHSIFGKVNYVVTKDWRRITKGYWALSDANGVPHHPQPRKHYVIGGDVASGVGSGRESGATDDKELADKADNTVAEIFCLEDEEQVAEFRRNDIEPDEFALKLKELGELHNGAFINIERNNHGILTIAKLLDSDYPRHLIHRGKETKNANASREYGKIVDYGTFTSEITRAQVIGNLRTLVKKLWMIHSPILKGEMDTFVETESGKQEAQVGCFDDCVMAAAMALWVVPKAATRMVSEEEARTTALPGYENTLEGIIAALEEKYKSGERQGMPISAGVKIA